MPDHAAIGAEIAAAVANQPTAAGMVAILDAAIAEVVALGGGVVSYTDATGRVVSRNLDQLKALREYYRQTAIDDAGGFVTAAVHMGG